MSSVTEFSSWGFILFSSPLIHFWFPSYSGPNDRNVQLQLNLTSEQKGTFTFSGSLHIIISHHLLWLIRKNVQRIKVERASGGNEKLKNDLFRQNDTRSHFFRLKERVVHVLQDGVTWTHIILLQIQLQQTVIIRRIMISPLSSSSGESILRIFIFNLLFALFSKKTLMLSFRESS